MRSAIVLLLAVSLAGCVTNGSRFSKKDYDENGKLAHSIVIKTRTYAFAGSKEASAMSSASACVDGRRVYLGQSAKGLEAGGDPAAIAEALAPILKAVESATPAGEAPGIGTLILKGIVGYLMK